MTVARVPSQDGASNPLWVPNVIFDANWSSDGGGGLTATADSRQLCHAPSVIFDARLGLFGLAFGSGNREDLWQKILQDGRFYLFIDDTDMLQPTNLPLDEGDFKQILVNDVNLNADLLVTRGLGQKGWFIEFGSDERVITEAFALSGISIFAAYAPETAINDDPDCDPISDPEGCEAVTNLTCGDRKFESDTDNLCARSGFSKNFVVATTSGDGFLFDDNGDKVRFEAVSSFVTDPFTEPGQNKNQGSDDAGSTSSDELTDQERDVMEELQGLFSETCCFANYRVDIKTVAADTRIERIAPVPICIIEKSWKEY